MAEKSPEYYFNLYKKKLIQRCETQFKLGQKKCESAFEKQYDSCYETVPAVLSVVCLPLKIDFICGLENLFASVADVCDPSSIIDADFGKNYKRLKEKGDRYLSHYGNVSIEIETADLRELEIVQSINKTSEGIATQLHEKKQFIDYLMRIFMKLMTLVYLKMIYGNSDFLIR